MSTTDNTPALDKGLLQMAEAIDTLRTDFTTENKYRLLGIDFFDYLGMVLGLEPIAVDSLLKLVESHKHMIDAKNELEK